MKKSVYFMKVYQGVKKFVYLSLGIAAFGMPDHYCDAMNPNYQRTSRQSADDDDLALQEVLRISREQANNQEMNDIEEAIRRSRETAADDDFLLQEALRISGEQANYQGMGSSTYDDDLEEAIRRSRETAAAEGVHLSSSDQEEESDQDLPPFDMNQSLTQTQNYQSVPGYYPPRFAGQSYNNQNFPFPAARLSDSEEESDHDLLPFDLNQSLTQTQSYQPVSGYYPAGSAEQSFSSSQNFSFPAPAESDQDLPPFDLNQSLTQTQNYQPVSGYYPAGSAEQSFSSSQNLPFPAARLSNPEVSYEHRIEGTLNYQLPTPNYQLDFSSLTLNLSTTGEERDLDDSQTFDPEYQQGSLNESQRVVTPQFPNQSYQSDSSEEESDQRNSTDQ